MPAVNRLPDRLLWLAIVVLAATALYCGLVRPHVTTLPKSITGPMEDILPQLPPPALPPLVVPELPDLKLPAPSETPLVLPPPKR